MGENSIQVSFGERLMYFDSSATLDEIATGLAGGDPRKKHSIHFSVMLNGQLTGIGDDIMMRQLRDSKPDDFRLIARVRSSELSLPFEFSPIDESESGSPSRSAQESIACTLRYRIGYSNELCEENFIRLDRPMNKMSLFDLAQLLIEAQGLSATRFTCYLYNKCGWPLAANIEQQHLIYAGAYLANGDFVFGIIWEEQPPRPPPAYVDPFAGSCEYCFDYKDNIFTIKLDPGCSIYDARMKLLWLLRVPLNTISVSNVVTGHQSLPDSLAITQIDLDNKTLKFNFRSVTTTFTQLEDLFERFDGKEMRKLYGYLYILKKNVSQDLQIALELVAFLLAQKIEPFLFAFRLVFAESSLSKAERVALFFGLQIMHKTFKCFVTSDQSPDYSLMFALVHHVASTLSSDLTPLLTVTECAEGRAQPVSHGISDDPEKEVYLISVLKYTHLVLPLLKVSTSCLRFEDYLARSRARPPFSFSQLANYLKEATYLTILHPRDIANGTLNRLTLHPNGELWICQGLEDNCRDIGIDQDAKLSDVLTGVLFKLQKRTLIDQVQRYLPSDSVGAVVSREPQEATVVIFDTSGSMDSKYQQGDTNTRLDAAKIFLLLLAQKTMSYDFPHVFSLCTFAGTSSFRFDFTENLDSFLEFMQGLKAEGGTALYSAMEQGIAKLQTIKGKFPNVSQHMVIISDGEDCGSRVTAKVVSDQVIQHNITVDVFAVGGNCALVKMIAKRSGGYCYYTDTIVEGVRMFESETILKLSLRKPTPPKFRSINSEEEFIKTAATVPFDTEPPEMVCPVGVDEKVCPSIRAFEIQVGAVGNNPFVVKRVLRELAKYNRDPHPDFALFPLSKNLFIWRGIVEGPRGTPYEGGLFDFYISFGEDYPGKAPEMRFRTPIMHPSVTQNGRICHPIFNTSYTTETSVRDILNQVYSLLLTQDFDDYVVSNLSITLSFNKEQFRQKAQEATQRYAIRGKTKKQLIKEMTEEDDCPENYKCALSMKLMRNPVNSPKSGKIFERSAIEKYVRRTGKDPLTSSPLQIDELIPDFRLQREINALYPL